MRKFLFSILLLFILSYIGPGLCATADDDRYKRPGIDIVDLDDPDTQNEDALGIIFLYFSTKITR